MSDLGKIRRGIIELFVQNVVSKMFITEAGKLETRATIIGNIKQSQIYIYQLCHAAYICIICNNIMIN